MDAFYKLYSECFPEDSALCADVIMKKLISSEKIAAYDGKDLKSALYLVKKILRYGNKLAEIRHITALGTFIKDRHKGYAERLIKEALNDAEVPFLTLYPFSHAFYEKYGFVAVSYDFDRPDGRGERIDVKKAKLLYDEFCDGLDYAFIRSEEDFAFFEEVYNADGESFCLVNGGLDSPDGYEPDKFFLTEKKGVMARVADLRKALALTDVTTDVRIKVNDGFVRKNNLIFTLDKGKTIPCDGFDIEVDAAEITKAVFGKSEVLKDIFPEKRGYLADRY